MFTLSPITISFSLATSLSLLPVLRPHLDPPAEPTTPPPAQKDDDVLRGPKVPPQGIESNRQFTGGKGGQKAAAPGGSRPTLEQNAFFTAIDAMKFEGDLKKSVDAARDEFLARLKAWETTAGEQRKALFESRKKAPSNEPPSEEFKKKMGEIEASRPKLGELQQRVYAMLTEDQGAQLKSAYDTELKRVRDEIARKTDEERKRRDEERKRREAERKGAPSDAKPKAPAKPNGPAPGGEKDSGKPPADPPMQPSA